MEEAQQNQLPQNHGARESKMPPVGNFQVPQNSKETKKRPRNSGVAPATSQPVVGESSRSGAAQGVPANKVSRAAQIQIPLLTYSAENQDEPQSQWS